MPKATILLADNSRDFAEIRAEILRDNGYETLIAFTTREAKEIADRGGIDLAILDIRLTDDDDARDVSGLALAQEIDPAIPKIIMSGFPSIDIVRQTLTLMPSGQPLAVSFVAKQEGVQALLSSIEHILPSLINVELTIDCDFDSFSTEEKTRILRILAILRAEFRLRLRQ